MKLVRCPRSLAPTLVTLPTMSLIPFAPFSELGERGLEIFDDFGGDDVQGLALAARRNAAATLRREAPRLRVCLGKPGRLDNPARLALSSSVSLSQKMSRLSRAESVKIC